MRIQDSETASRTFEYANLALDILLVVIGLLIVGTVLRAVSNPEVRHAAFQISIGALALGLAHLLETITFELMGMPIEQVEFIHRLVVLAGFVFMLIGFGALGPAKR